MKPSLSSNWGKCVLICNTHSTFHSKLHKTRINAQGFELIFLHLFVAFPLLRPGTARHTATTIFKVKDGDNMFLRNVGIHLPRYRGPYCRTTIRILIAWQAQKFLSPFIFHRHQLWSHTRLTSPIFINWNLIHAISWSPHLTSLLLCQKSSSLAPEFLSTTTTATVLDVMVCRLISRYGRFGEDAV